MPLIKPEEGQRGRSAPLVSVIVPVYNGAYYIERALNSALAQTISDLELVVIDDASTDPSAEVVRKVAAHDPRVRLLQNECNRGLSASRNRAIDMAWGKWVALLDADDTWAPKRLERLLAVADSADVVSDDLVIEHVPSGKSVGIRAADVFLLQVLSIVKPRRFLSRQGMKVLEPHRLSIYEFVRYDLGLLKPIIRRSFLQRHELKHDANLAIVPDFHLYFEMLLSGARWVQLPTAYYCYHWHSSNMSKDTIKLAQEVIWSAETLLTKPAVVTDAALIAALQRRLREWRSHEAFALVRSFQIPPQSGELMRLLHRRPALFLLIIKKVIRSLYWRAFWGIGNLSSHWRA